MRGASDFAEWLPDEVIGFIQGGAGLPAAGVAEAVSVAVAATLFVLIVHVVATMTSGLRDLVSGRSVVRRGDGGLGGLRRVAGFAVIGVPWYHVFCILTDGELPSGSADQAGLLAALWVALGAMDHRATWLELDKGVVIARRGFAVFRRHTLTLSLIDVFRGPAGRPIGDLERLMGRRVSIDPQAIEALAAFRGGETQAKAYLEAVLAQAGGRLAA